MLLPQDIERLEPPALFDMPESPAIARWQTLERRAYLVDGPRMGIAAYRAVRVHGRRPAAFGIG